MVILDLPHTDTGTETLTEEPREKAKGSKIMGVLRSQTTSLSLPRDKTIKISTIAGPSEGVEWELSRPLMTLGRAGGSADIAIDDPGISSLHCAIEVRSDAILLHDLSSRNGTYVDNSRVVAARLEQMSQFRIGSSLLQVSIFSTADGSLVPRANELLGRL